MKVCIPITETTVAKALGVIKEANPVADLIELRVDYLRTMDLEPLLNGRERPFIVTNRRRKEGGKYRGDERERILILREGLDQGPEYVDVEIRTERRLLQDLIANKKQTLVVLSFHDFHETPSQRKLRKICDQMIQFGADVAKIVTFARSWEDNLKILSLIPYARKRKQAVVAFCMGEKGKMSRIFAPQMGAAWTYASLDKKRISAPGQLTALELKDIWRRFR